MVAIMDKLTCIWFVIVNVLDSHAGAITTVATIVIAAFTVALAISTKKLWVSTEKSIDLGRDEFNATHRPKIIVHTFEVSLDAGTGYIGAIYTYVNAGESDATIKEIGGIMFMSDGLRAGIQITMKPLKKVLKVGERTTRSIDSEILNSNVTIASMRTGRGQPSRRLMCIGCIRYADAKGVKRETGFCRTYDAVSSTWLREQNSDYEYSY